MSGRQNSSGGTSRPVTPMVACLGMLSLIAGWAFLPGEKESVAILMQDGKAADARAILEARVIAGDAEPTTVFELFRLRLHFGESAAAASLLQRYADAAPGRSWALREVAGLYRTLTDAEAETAALERLLAERPDVAAYRRLLGLYRLAGSFDREAALIRTAQAAGYADPQDVARLGGIMAGEERLTEAAELLQAVIDHPDCFRWRATLLHVLSDLHRDDEAIGLAVKWAGPSGERTPAETSAYTFEQAGRPDLSRRLLSHMSGTVSQ